MGFQFRQSGSQIQSSSLAQGGLEAGSLFLGFPSLSREHGWCGEGGRLWRLRRTTTTESLCQKMSLLLLNPDRTTKVSVWSTDEELITIPVRIITMIKVSPLLFCKLKLSCLNFFRETVLQQQSHCQVLRDVRKTSFTHEDLPAQGREGRWNGHDWIILIQNERQYLSTHSALHPVPNSGNELICYAEQLYDVAIVSLRSKAQAVNGTHFPVSPPPPSTTQHTQVNTDSGSQGSGQIFQGHSGIFQWRHREKRVVYKLRKRPQNETSPAKPWTSSL